jgi:chemosensory pili system protein ChpA (sensor histidine kinase/response regulator)
MIDTARVSFRDWVDALRRTGRVEPDAGKLRAALRIVEGELLQAAKTPAIEPAVEPSTERPTEPSTAAAAPIEAASVTPISPAVPSTVTEPAIAQSKVVETPRLDASKPAAKRDIWSVALVQPSSTETLAGVRDEIDIDLVARFLEEAGKLLPEAREQLHAWRETPSDRAAADRLRRALHAVKGGARMAGAMRLGQLLQSMESRLATCEHRAAPPELFQAFDTDLDFIGYMLERLTAGESNVVLPRLAPKAQVAAKPAIGPELAGTPPQAVQGPIVLPVAGSRDDRIRVLKANLTELAQGMTGLSRQIREIEAQAEVQMRSRMTELHERGGECDSSELDGLTRVQDLVHSLAEALNGLTTVQQSLLHHLDDSAAALAPAPGTAARYVAEDICDRMHG